MPQPDSRRSHEFDSSSSEKPDVSQKPSPQERAQQKEAPSYDAKFAQEMNKFWVEKNKAYVEGDKANYAEHGGDWQQFFSEVQYTFKSLANAKQIESIRQSGDLRDFADGLCILGSDFGSAKSFALKDYKGLLPEYRAVAEQNQKRFLEVCRRLFPYIRMPRNTKERTFMLGEMQKTAVNLPLGEAIRSDLEQVNDSSDLKEMARRLDTAIVFAANRTDNLFNYEPAKGTEEHLGVAEENKKLAVETAKFTYQLQLIRDQLQAEIYGRSDVSPTDARKIDEVRSTIDDERSKELSP